MKAALFITLNRMHGLYPQWQIQSDPEISALPNKPKLYQTAFLISPIIAFKRRAKIAPSTK